MQKDYRLYDGRAKEFWQAQWDAIDVDSHALRAFALGNREDAKIMAPYLATLSRGARILDAGCGTGDWCFYLANKGFEVVGIDITGKTIDAIKGTSSKIEFICGDFRRTDFPDAAFDACLAFGSFEHFEEGLEAPLVEARRVLKPGGYLFASVPHQNLRHLLWNPEAAPPAASARFYQWRFTRKEFHAELAMRGFSVLEMRRMHKWTGLRKMAGRIVSSPRLRKALCYLMLPVIPKFYAAHMLMAVARRTEESRE